jgi:hypothetical protein
VLNSLPAEARVVIANGMQLLQRETANAIARITANAAGVYTEAELKAMDFGALQKLDLALNAAKPQAGTAGDNTFGSLFGVNSGNAHGVHVGGAGMVNNDAGDLPVLKRPVW